MENRAWTTRLQNSIRALVPEFDHSLVYNVLHGAKNSEQALQFFRCVERAGLIRHDREVHMKIIQILDRASKLNHANIKGVVTFQNEGWLALWVDSKISYKYIQ